jgi:hypothetical protein
MWTFLIAVLATSTLAAGVRWYSATAPISAGISFAEEVFTPSSVVAAELGGPLSPEEIARIKLTARREVERAFAGLRVRVVETPRAFWRVRVLPTVQLRRNRRAFATAGASYGFGPLGGAGFVNFTALAVNAVRYAPVGTPRAAIVEAIGRGIGRSAVHEFAHMIAPDVAIHDTTDPDSYEESNTARYSQYYGELRWGNAWPVLHARLAAADAE